MSAAIDLDQQRRQEVSDFARVARLAGFSVVPPREDGTKAPIGEWKSYQKIPVADDRFEHWYSDARRHGVGFVTGFGGLECMDFDDATAWDDFRDLAERAGLGELLERVASGYLERTPHGRHLMWRCSEPGGCTKLAFRPKTAEELSLDRAAAEAKGDDPSRIGEHKTRVEMKASGGFVIVAPSCGPVNAGGDYVLERGGPATIETVTADERDDLLNIARAMDEAGAAKAAAEYRRTEAPLASTDGVRPGDDYARHTPWSDILEPHGWRQLFTTGDGTTHWCRPGKRSGTSATTGHAGTDFLYVFSTSTELESGRGYGKFSAYAHLEHGADFKAAARALREGGFGESRNATPVDLTRILGNGAPSEDQTPDNDDGWNTIAEIGDWFRQAPRPRDWLLKRGDNGSMSKGEVGMLVAPGSRGKSHALCQLALSVATGIDWLGTYRVTTPGRVVLALAEEKLDEIHRRLYSAAHALALTEEQRRMALERIVPFGWHGKPVSLVEGEGRDVTTSDKHGWLRDRLERHGPHELVILDPLSRFAPDVESSNAAATAACQALEDLTKTPGNPSVIIAHHTNKWSRRDGNKAGGAATRGVTGLFDGIRWQAQLTGTTESDLAFAITKGNYGPPEESQAIPLERAEGGTLIPADPGPRAIALANAANAKMEADRDAARAWVLERVRENPGKTKTKIAEMEGIAKQRALDAIRDLLAEGLLEDRGSVRSSSLEVVDAA